MSDQHDHPHEHGHGHDHGHSHEHDHPPAGAAEESLPDDSASQALADALRSSFVVVRFIMVLLVVAFLFSGVKVIGPQEQAVRLRFGKVTGQGTAALLGPGAHWAFPYPIDEIVRIPVGRQQTLVSSVGWYATSAAMEAVGQEGPPRPSLNPAVDGYALTADGNIIHTRATLNYTITDPIRYAFSFVDSSNLVLNALNNAVLQTAVQFPVDELLTSGLTAFQERLRAQVERQAEQQQLGITVGQVSAQIIPPRFLSVAFAAVGKASASRGKLINDSRSYESEVTNRAVGEATVRINAGENDRNRLVTSIAEEARRFEKLLPAYQRNPDFFVRQQQIETLQRVLTNAQDKIILTERADGRPRELRIQLNRELPKQKTVGFGPAENH